MDQEKEAIIMSKRELVVIGAGPAGLTAAIEAAKQGVDVLLVDENLKAGGQLFKQIHKFFGSSAHRSGVRGIDIGKELIEESKELGIDVWLNSIVMGVLEGNEVLIEKTDNNTKKLETVIADKIIIATGASEKALHFEGWTMPGVMGAGAAQTMINVHRVLPGKKVLMIGSGNVGLIVSYQLIQAGAEIVGIVDAASEIGGYGVHSSKVERAGVPFYLNHTILKAGGRDETGVEGAVIAEVDDKWEPIPGTEKNIEADVITIAAGLKPLSELAIMSGCQRTYISELGGWLPLHNENMESTVSGIYVVGDVTGVEEANTALEEGRLAGVDAADKLGYFKDNAAKDLKNEIRDRVKGLRLGPFGEDRLKAKEDIIKKFYELENKTNADSNQKKDGPYAVIECEQEIPCNPCEPACKFGAIKIGDPITNLPEFDIEKCTGCGLCLPACPGLAIFLVDETYSEDKSTVAFPYEYQGLPGKGETVNAVDRKGDFVCKAEVVKVQDNKAFDRTPIVTIAVPDKYINAARNIEVAAQKGGGKIER